MSSDSTHSKEETNGNTVISVVDAKALMSEYIGFGSGILLSVASLLWGLFLEPVALIALPILIPMTIVMQYIIKAKKKGFIIDVDNNTYTYPGGREADDMSDYFKLDWYLQKWGLKRGEIQLSSITRISWEDTTHKTWNKQFGKWNYAHTHEISIEGVFGSIRNQLSRGKRDQLYAMLRQTLNMGDPIVIVNN